MLIQYPMCSSVFSSPLAVRWGHVCLVSVSGLEREVILLLLGWGSEMPCWVFHLPFPGIENQAHLLVLLFSNFNVCIDLVKTQIPNCVWDSISNKAPNDTVMLICRLCLEQPVSKWNTFKIAQTSSARGPEWLCGIEPYTEHIVWVK